MSGAELAVGEALLALDEVTRRLRRECPWDREQDERSIVPHTVEEAYELADAAHSGDDAKLLDELGDVLFQVYFLALLLEERGEGDLATVARGVTEKLVRRHPHVFERGRRRARRPADRGRDARQVKRELGRDQARGARRRDPLAACPRRCRRCMYARKLQRRAAGGSDRGDPARCARPTCARRLERRRAAVAAEGPDAEAQEQTRHGSERLYERDRRAPVRGRGARALAPGRSRDRAAALRARRRGIA